MGLQKVEGGRALLALDVELERADPGRAVPAHAVDGDAVPGDAEVEVVPGVEELHHLRGDLLVRLG